MQIADRQPWAACFVIGLLFGDILLTGSADSGLEGTDKDGGIDPGVVEADVPVHMGAGGATGRTDSPDDAATWQALTELHIDLRHVAEHADEPLTVVDKDGIAIEEVVADQDHLACGRGLDRGAGADSEVEAGVGVALLAIEEATQAKRAGEGAVDRLVEHQVARLVGAEGLVSPGLLRQLAVDTCHILGERIDLTAVLELDVLLAVVLGGHGEAENTAITCGQLLGPKRVFERDADDGDPLVVFAHHQHGFVVIAGRGGSGRCAKRDHRNATRHRMVEQATDKTLGQG
ncbi:hypothetical protein AERO8C_30076 [Aeromonas veronii]|uniref:Uncharacterized protein n=1 Tax=Aeromonas veronii TaxID=654 RepID=A0A653L5Z8_AERVE|nr:hypothetical protein AERO8C_30076 [Aeromonas veronii]